MKRAIVITSILFSGCTSFLSELNSDDGYVQNTTPTIGGQFPEAGIIEQVDPEYVTVPTDQKTVGRRYPASDYYQEPAQAPWVNENVYASTQNGDVRAPAAEPFPNYKKTYGRARASDFLDRKKNEGSLWAPDGQTNHYFSKNRVLSVGDIVTIQVGKELVRDTRLEVLRTLNEDEREIELAVLNRKLNEAALAEKGKNKKPKPEESDQAQEEDIARVEATTLTYKDMDSVELQEGEKILAEVIERFPNGNYMLRGAKRVPHLGKSKMVAVTGVARWKDFTDGETIDSDKLFEYRVEVGR